MAANREEHLTSMVVELFRDLKAGRSGPHDENRAARQQSGMAVVTRVQLEHVPREARTPRRHARTLEHPSRDHDVVSAPQSAVRPNGEAAIVQPIYGLNGDTFMDRCVEAVRVAFEEPDDLVTGHETIRGRAVVVLSWKTRHPVGREKCQRIPAFAPPALDDPSTLENDVLLACAP